ncbi:MULTISPECIES: hypothetical protein [Stenotrophomonas]|uniref:hypothetical protein n=1 Tax=Stenotrophomonas TaxID=40323 RepID=UPI0021C65C6F|nr:MULTISPECIES: hypothetical protein [Stenotrophomonas]MCU1136964.1 hypothetical protein [Stenotrophomonas maltophilia]MEC4339711.1 hypothetical protein [Stenotrophomonas pavanii]
MFDLFGQVPEKAETTRNPRRVRDFGKEPKQKTLQIKLLRKIAFRRRYHEVKGAGNEEVFSIAQIMRLHAEMYQDFEDRFPVCETKEEKLDFWLWMLGDANDPFSFRDCLVAVGYQRTRELIETIGEQVPTWVSEIIEATPKKQEELLHGLASRPSRFQHALKKIKKQAKKAA